MLRMDMFLRILVIFYGITSKLISIEEKIKPCYTWLIKVFQTVKHSPNKDHT